MKHILFLRRQHLGHGSTIGLMNLIGSTNYTSGVLSIGQQASVVRNDQLHRRSVRDLMRDQNTLIVRWGTTSGTGMSTTRQLNPSSAISFVSDKGKSRIAFQQAGVPVPKSMSSTLQGEEELSYPLIIRPNKHSGGRNLFFVNNLEEFLDVVDLEPSLRDGWYAGEYIPKVAEYRVYVMSGRVMKVETKLIEDTTAIAWNECQGSKFKVLRWSEWPLRVCDAALKAAKVSGLDFGGIDVMEDSEGNPYVLEANSAPSIPNLRDGSPSHSQKCFVKCLKHIGENGKEHFEYVENPTSWRDLIHPAVT